jgi:hypothetical protein
MKNRYKIQIDPHEPDEQSIRNYQDFDSLLQRYLDEGSKQETKGTGRVLRFAIWTSLVAAALAFFLYIRIGEDASPMQKQKAYFAAQPYINPPLENIRPAFTSEAVSTQKGQVIEFASGSRLTIPPAAFVDQEGSPLSGDVEIKYREFHDYVDFFLSGIPMIYDSAGIQYTLESAGMIEIYAEQDGHKVFLHPEKKLDVEVVSEISVPHLDVPPNFNIYKLNEEERRWEFRSRDNIRFANKTGEEQVLPTNTNPGIRLKQELEEKVHALEEEKKAKIEDLRDEYPLPPSPIKPRAANGTDLVFDFDMEDISTLDLLVSKGENQLSEEDLKEKYAQSMWQLAPGTVANEKAMEGITWEDIRLKQLNERDFELTLFYGSSSMTLTVNPVLSPSDYQEALTGYENDLARYQEKEEEREALLVDEIKALESAFEQEKQTLQLSYQERIASYQADKQTPSAQDIYTRRKVISRFVASEFGIWNCDRPLPPAYTTVKASFSLENGQKLEHTTAFLVDKKQNTIRRIYIYEGCPLQYNRNSENLLWLITEDKKMAVFRPEAFKQLKTDSDGSQAIAMQVVDRPLESEADVREVLFF